MKKKLFFLLIIFLVFSLETSFSESKNFSSKKNKLQTIVAEPPLETFTVGESLFFDVSWMGIPVGTGSLEIREKVRVRGRNAFHVVAVAQTNEFLSKIYPIHDEVHSFIDDEKFYSLEFQKNLKEGHYRADERISYDHEAKKAFYESLRNKSKKEISIPVGIHDFISAFFWFRLQPLEVGKSFHTLVNSEAENWDLEIRVLEFVTKELKGERVIPTVRVEPRTRLKGMLYDRGRAWVYFSVDSQRLPVWIALQTPFGPVVGVLRTKAISN